MCPEIPQAISYFSTCNGAAVASCLDFWTGHFLVVARANIRNARILGPYSYKRISNDSNSMMLNARAMDDIQIEPCRPQCDEQDRITISSLMDTLRDTTPPISSTTKTRRLALCFGSLWRIALTRRLQHRCVWLSPNGLLVHEGGWMDGRAPIEKYRLDFLARHGKWIRLPR